MTPESAPQRVESPCIKVCLLDRHNVCVGCGRTLDEIAAWSRLTAEEQRAVCSVAAERLKSAAVSASRRSP
jgi:predicted Fe-S protein YdhL (DUF1289 family)